MNEEAAQTTATPSNGASNASDFQPTTQNPQTAPVNLFQQQGAVQNVTNTQELLTDQRNVRISVASEPAPAAPAVAQANESPLMFILAFIVIAAAILFVVIKRLRSNSETPALSEPQAEIVEAEPMQEVEEVQPIAPSAQATAPSKKKSSKKSKSKRKRR